VEEGRLIGTIILAYLLLVYYDNMGFFAESGTHLRNFISHIMIIRLQSLRLKTNSSG
jgi:hypothetical protein